MALPQNILIVGGGVFGLSTALSLSHRHPTTKITLLDSSPLPNPHGSSVDTSRIVRADYSHHVYANLAAKAIHHWRSTEWGHEGRYTQNGLLLVYPEGAGNGRDYAMKSYENVRKLEGEKMVELLPGKEEVLRAAPAYGRELNFAGGYVNWGSGWSDAEASVRFIAEKLQKEGKVSIKTDADVLSLLYDDSNNVTGVSLANGTALYADLTILATGAWTTKLIDLRGRTLSTGQALAYMRISDEEQSRLAHMPTILNFTTGIFIIPPRNNLLKIARHGYGYHNPVRVSVPGKGKDGVEVMEVSLPEKDVPVPTEGQEAFRDALKQLLPSLADRPFVSTRVCWYTDTPQGDFIVSSHPTHRNLFLATGGSGHAYKFFPILGDKVVDALEGSLEPELQMLWAWPEEKGEDVFEGTEDGSRSGEKKLLLREELGKGGNGERGSKL